jgi:NAD(P)H-dependent FMN reductase
MIKILGICGSPSPKSIGTLALEVTMEEARKRGAQAEIFSLSATPLPLFDNKTSYTEAQVQRLKSLVLNADAIVLSTPDYHGGPSGLLKNCLDHFWKELAGRLFGYICSSFEKGLTPMDQLRTHVRQCYGWSLPYGVSLSDADLSADRSSISNDKVEERLKLMAYDLVRYAGPMRKLFEEDRLHAGHGFASHYPPK